MDIKNLLFFNKLVYATVTIAISMSKINIKILKTVYWLNLLLRQTKKNPYQLERFLYPGKRDDELNHKFHRYALGKTTVSAKTVEYVDQFSEKTSGLKWVFTHPLWEILSNPNIEINTLNNLMGQLPVDIYNKLFVSKKSQGKSHRRSLRDVRQIEAMAFFHNIDALAALLLIMRGLDIQQSEQDWPAAYYVQAKWESLHLISRLATLDDVFREVASNINDIVYEKFILKNNPLNERYKWTDEHRTNDTENIGESEYPYAYCSPEAKPNIDYEIFINLYRLQRGKEDNQSLDTYKELMTFLYYQQDYSRFHHLHANRF